MKRIFFLLLLLCWTGVVYGQTPLSVRTETTAPTAADQTWWLDDASPGTLRRITWANLFKAPALTGAATFGSLLGTGSVGSYGSFTDASNWRQFLLSQSSGGIFTISSAGLGTGAAGNTIELATNGTTRVSVGDTYTTINGTRIGGSGANSIYNATGGIGLNGNGNSEFISAGTLTLMASSRTLIIAADGGAGTDGVLYPNTDAGASNTQIYLGKPDKRFPKIFLGPEGAEVGNGTNGPTITATGTSPNESLVLTAAGTGTVQVAGLLDASLKIPVKHTSANYTVGTTDARELYGGVIYVEAAATITAPAVVAGASFTVITIGAVAVSVDVNAADLTYLNGTALADGDKITNASLTGDMAVFTYYDATGWVAMTNSGWTDGN